MNNSASILLLVCFAAGNVCVKAFDYEASLSELKTKVSQECYKDVAAADKDDKNFIIQATLAWNASTPGLINGSHDYTGNYEGCLAPSQDASKPLSQYCVFDVGVTYENGPGIPTCSHDDSRFSGIRCSNSLKWALCAPSSCSRSEMLAVAEVLVKKSDIGRAGLPFTISLPDYACQTAAKAPFGTLAYAFFSLLGAIAAIVVYCTVYHFYLRCKHRSQAELNVPLLVLNWSLLQNWSALWASPKGEMRVFHSLRFISTCMVIVMHRGNIHFVGPLANFEESSANADAGNMLRLEFAVDTFFAIGGFLLVRNFLCSSNKNPVEMIVSRYFRLVPIYALIVFYACSVLEYTGAGPFWPEILHQERDSCRTSWWLALLMLANYGQWDQFCWLPTWYVPCDFHFFVVGVAVCCLMRRSRTLGVAALHLLIVASVVLFSAIILHVQLPVFLPRIIDTKRSVRYLDYVDKVYVKSHMRIGSYLVGMLGGYYAHTYAQPGKAVSQKTVEKLSKLSYVMMASTLLSGFVFLGYSNDVVLALYGALVRPIWSGGVCLFALAALFGKIPRLSKFLDLDIWVPLSKITYSMYCVHLAKQLADIGSQMQPLHFHPGVVCIPLLGDFLFAVVAAVPLYMCVEAPCSGFVSILLRNTRRRKDKTT